MTPYAQYKESGVEWIGEIPAHWEVSKLKYAFDFLDHRRIPISADERGKMSHKIYDYYGASGVIDKVDDYIFTETTILVGEDGANLLSRSSRYAELAFDREMVLAFLQRTQPKAWQKLVSIHRNKVEEKVLRRLFHELGSRGMLDVLRHGMIDYGVRLKLAYFKPAHGLNPENLAPR